MPQNTHIELIEAETERVPQGAKESAPDLDRLSSNAAEVAQLLARHPSVHASPFFTVPWNAMAAVLRPVLDQAKRSPARPPDAGDLRCSRANLPPLCAHSR